MASPRYLDVGEVIAVEHVSKVVTAHVLTSPDMTPAIARKLTGYAKAVRLYSEVREYAEAIGIIDVLIGTIKDPTVGKVLRRSRKTLARSVSLAK